MNLLKNIIVFLLLWVPTARSGVDILDIIHAPRDISLGMTEGELAGQKKGLFPGPLVRVEGSNFSFKTLMEINGMGSPGHQSFYYLFEADKLQGVIHTTSLIGMSEVEGMRVAALHYSEIEEVVSGSPTISEILRRDGNGFSKVTLEKWSIQEGAMSVFHVATNYESSVGVLSGKTNFPTNQLFISADDNRFQGLITSKAIILDFSRDQLKKGGGRKSADGGRVGADLASFEQGKLRGGEKSSVTAVDSHGGWSPSVLVLLAVFSFLCVVCIFIKIKSRRV